MKHFISNPLRKYLDAHTKLNSYIKVSTVAIDFLSNSTSDKQELSDRINNLILSSDQRWTDRIIHEPHDYLLIVKNELNQSAIINVYSAFDVFLTSLTSRLSECGNQTFKAQNDENEVIEVSKLTNLYKKLAWDMDCIKEILPVFRFYKELRNCVAHNMGVPNTLLKKISVSEEFLDAIKNWKTKFPKKNISDPPVISEDFIRLEPHHAIMYSETCLKIAKDMNSKMYIELGLNHFINKAIKRHLTVDKNLTEPKCSDLMSYLKSHLKIDYNIEVSKNEIRLFYSDWDVLKKHKKRYVTLSGLSQKDSTQ